MPSCFRKEGFKKKLTLKNTVLLYKSSLTELARPVYNKFDSLMTVWKNSLGAPMALPSV